MKGGRLAEHLACRSSGTIMVICSNLTVSATSNVGKVLPCACVRLRARMPSSTRARQRTSIHDGSNLFPSDARFTEQIGHVHKRMEVEQSKKSSCFGDKSARAHLRTPRARADTLHMQQFLQEE